MKDITNELSEKYNQVEKEKLMYRDKCEKLGKENQDLLEKLRNNERNP